jgi:glycosyltransferase involved in cell wall biosynthesis
MRKQTKTEKFMPKVSVIIPVFNTQNVLVQCLESIVSQTLQDIEIIVVDDSSETKPKVKDVIK